MEELFHGERGRLFEKMSEVFEAVENHSKRKKRAQGDFPCLLKTLERAKRNSASAGHFFLAIALLFPFLPFLLTNGFHCIAESNTIGIGILFLFVHTINILVINVIFSNK